MIKKLKKINWKKVTTKALHTFWQAFIGAIVITDYTVDGIKIAIIGAALSAVKNTLVEMTKEV